jgi:hypothetical protein
MRLLPTTLALLLSTASMVASTTDARAQAACNNFSPLFQGNWQAQLGNNSCSPLTGVSVTVAVTQDIVVSAATPGYNGFSMQLNANGPSSGLTSSQLFWQQFVIMVGSNVEGFTQQWANNSKDSDPGIYPTNPTVMGTPSTLNDAKRTIPAGTTFTWSLANDSAGNIESVTYSAHDNLGTSYAPVTEYIPVGDRTPIYSIMMEVIGYTDGSFTSFQSGAGTITYSATSLSPAYDFPKCADNTGTAENSDMAYGPLDHVIGGTVTQEFFASTVGGFWDGNCGFPGSYPSSLGDWAPGDYKGVCPLTTPMYGVSRVPGQLWTEAVECGTPEQPAYNYSGGGCYARAVHDYDDRGDTDNGTDWDPGAYKTECAPNEFVAGVSQSSGNGELTSILCCPGGVTHQSCDTQVFYDSDSAAYTGPDWNPRYHKGQCPAGQYVAGISTPAYAAVGETGAAHAILCCSQ